MSCLFDSLCSFAGVGSRALREQICSFLLQNPQIAEGISISEAVKWLYDQSLPDYVSQMENHSTWGGAIEIKAFCEMFRRNVVVVAGGAEIEFVSTNAEHSPIRINWSGCHFWK